MSLNFFRQTDVKGVNASIPLNVKVNEAVSVNGILILSS